MTTSNRKPQSLRKAKTRPNAQGESDRIKVIKVNHAAKGKRVAWCGRDRKAETGDRKGGGDGESY
jgi:hypothetical protein